MDDFEPTLKTLDLGLFRHVVSQSTDNDRRAFLALQLAAREDAAGYVYLEIGSYKGGSLQPHVVDPKYVHIHSIDLRPRNASDVRGAQNYLETARRSCSTCSEASPARTSPSSRPTKRPRRTSRRRPGATCM
jgi:hypothetical protein